ncbi:16068_t:CDS:2, partial [Rhizophagus irregularis]
NFAQIISDWFIVEECLKDDNGETEELMQAYIDMEFPAALIHKMVFFYEIATYICENDQGYFVKQQLHVGDV